LKKAILNRHVKYYMHGYLDFIDKYPGVSDELWAMFLASFYWPAIDPMGTRDYSGGPMPLDLAGPFVEYACALLQSSSVRVGAGSIDDRILDVISQILPSDSLGFSEDDPMNSWAPSILDSSLSEEGMVVIPAYSPFRQIPPDLEERFRSEELAPHGKWEEVIHLAWPAAASTA
jgi:hypothetical protein